MDWDVLLLQKAVFWPPGPIDKSGQKSFGAAVEIPCRWEDKQQQRIDKDGNIWTSKAAIYTTYQIQNEGMIWRGAMADLTSPTNPKANVGAAVIRALEDIPELDDPDEDALFTAYL